MTKLEDARRALHAAAVQARLDACHEEVECPKCNAPIGERCRRMASITQRMKMRRYPGEVVAPHVERWSQVVTLL